MSNLTKENRAAVLSIRAKARKAGNVTGVEIPASVRKHLDAVTAWADGALKVTAIKPKAKAEAAEPVATTA